MDCLNSGERETGKAVVHAALGLLAGLCTVYNAAAWVQRRETHLAANALVYGALTVLEHRQVQRHRRSAQLSGALMRTGLALALLLPTAACIHAPPTTTVTDHPTIALFAATCRWTWWDEMGDTIDHASLLACVAAAIGGQTVSELRAVLRARPDYYSRARHRYYGQPPPLGLRAP